jgi:crotonobetaine/carnitine-CoA ligase
MAKEASLLSPFSRYDIAQWLSDLASRRGPHLALIWPPFETATVSWTYAEFDQEVAAVAGGLVARGIKPGDRVLVHLENCPNSLFVRFACAWIDACCVSTNANAVGRELSYFADKVGGVAAVTQPKFANLLNASRMARIGLPERAEAKTTIT